MKRRRGYSSDSGEVEINLTPLIDVVFVVLIVFIIIAPMLEIDRIDLADGGTTEQKKLVSFQQKSPIMIQVKSDDTIWIEKRCIRIEDLEKELKKVHSQKPNITPQLFHDRDAKFGTYQHVKTALENAGFKDVDLVLKPGR